VLIVDAANVIGSRPTGWWRDRPGAARDFLARVRAAVEAGALDAPVVVVLEGQAKAGAPERSADGVEVVHATGSGDDTIAALASVAAGGVVVVTADRALRTRVQAVGAAVTGPSWLLDRLPS
jgi:predicted RNA-binding protein with PIN domain